MKQVRSKDEKNKRRKTEQKKITEYNNKHTKWNPLAPNFQRVQLKKLEGMHVSSL